MSDTDPAAIAENHRGDEPVVVVTHVADELGLAPGDATEVTVRDDGAVVLASAEERGGDPT